MTLLVSAVVRFHSDLIAVPVVYASETPETVPERKEGREKTSRNQSKNSKIANKT
jgi:hypothetical protein